MAVSCEDAEYEFQQYANELEHRYAGDNSNNNGNNGNNGNNNDSDNEVASHIAIQIETHNALMSAIRANDLDEIQKQRREWNESNNMFFSTEGIYRGREEQMEEEENARNDDIQEKLEDIKELNRLHGVAVRACMAEARRIAATIASGPLARGAAGGSRRRKSRRSFRKSRKQTRRI